MTSLVGRSADRRISADCSVDAYTKFYAAFDRRTLVVTRHFALYLDRTADGIDDAGEFGKETVAGRFDDASVMLVDPGSNHFAPQLDYGGVRTLLVLAHQPAVAGDIGGEDRGKSAFDRLSRHARPLPAVT